ncbi:unnamed protein product [Candidula unifasciata]|uniref:C2H2-type domain-containing protein n=1 Tax=Candidula unifasciata TaxID=100452 RepID=A0A8S3YYG8_9EUPU|nr:unnamed protein product [Candidula unifasciata]
MATLECNNGQDGFSPTENGEVLQGGKSANIDYSEDLWLANSEDSTGPYAQQPSKVLTQEVSYAYSCRSEVGYSNSSATHDSTGSSGSTVEVKSELPENHANSELGHVWSEHSPDNHATTLQPATSYMNGLVEPNGLDFNSSGDEKDFAQLVPAGSYEENSSVTAVENQDKTFTSLMPAAAMDMHENLQAEFGTQRQMGYYGSTDQMNDCERAAGGGEAVVVSYDQSLQMAAVNGEREKSGEEGSNAVYISLDGLTASGHSMSPSGNFAMIRMGNNESYTSNLLGEGYQHISTLPFVQNGTYSTLASFHPSAVSSINGEENHQQVAQHSNYGSEQTSFSCDSTALAACTMLTPTVNTVEYQDDEDDDDDDEQEDDPSQDMEDDSMECSELTCPVCSEAFVDQATLEDHMANHPTMKSFVCNSCGKDFATRRYLRYHRKNHCKRAGSYEGQNTGDENDPSKETKRFACNVCHRPFRVLKCMKVHKKKKHGIQKEYTCPSCAVTFTSLQDLTDHSCGSKSVPSTPQIVQYTPPPLVVPSQKRKKKLKNAKPACDICGKTFSDRISVDIHRVKHIEEEFYPCDMCEEHENLEESHLAVYFRIRFFTDDNQHILEDQKAAVACHDQSRSDEGSSISATPVHPGSATPQSTPATPLYHPTTPMHLQDTPMNHLDVSMQHLDTSTNHPMTPRSSGNYIRALDCPEDEQVQLVEDVPGDAEVMNQANFTHTSTEVEMAEGRATFSLSGFSSVQNNCLPAGDQSLLINQHQEQQQEQPQLVYDADFQDGEVIHDANGSVLAVAPKKKKVKRTKVHTCDICNKSFGDAAKLGLHYKSNHLHDRPYQCDVCDKSFFTKWKLQRHMLSHLEQKPHSCPMCSKSFVERGKLEAHYRTHLGTKPYKCDQCPKAFTVKSQLSIHQRRIHSTDQPFGCLVCGKAFLWKSGLDKHMRKHTREKPYICESCGVKYSNKANLIVHMSKAHNQTYVDK